MSRIFKGGRLKEARLAKGLTQDDLAKLINVNVNQVSRWELGKNEPSLEVSAKLAKELGVTLDYFVGLVQEPQQRIEEPQISPVERLILQAYRSRRFQKLFQLLFPDDPGDEGEAQDSVGDKKHK
jgi:putative transcriptional regulator